jgi:hypothetical protein
MAILVVIIRCLAAVMAGQEDDKVGQQVGQRMDTIGHQRLRLGKYADQDLGAGQYDIDPDADHGAAVRGFIACGFIYRFVWSMAGVYGHGKAVRIGGKCSMPQLA